MYNNYFHFIYINGLDISVVTKYSEGFPDGPDGKASACNAGDPGSIPGSGRSLEKEMAIPSSTLAWESPMDREAWQATVHGSQRLRHNLETKPPPNILKHHTVCYFLG